MFCGVNSNSTKFSSQFSSYAIKLNNTFDFITKCPPASSLLKQAVGIAKGSGVPNKEKVGKVTREQLRQVAEKKMPDLNAGSLEAACRLIEGTARSMGLDVVD